MNKINDGTALYSVITNNEGGIIINPENELGYILVNGEAINMPSSSSWNSHEDWSKEIETWESGSQDLVMINNVDFFFIRN